MSHLLRKFSAQCVKQSLLKPQDFWLISPKNLSIIPSVYEGERDPAPIFFSLNVQLLLKRLTRPDLQKVFRKRTSDQLNVLKTPKYKFLTTEELEAEISKAHRKADALLQMPPVVKVYTPIEEVISKDPAITGYDSTKYLFTDITFGVNNDQRIIVERDPDGVLRSADHDVRKRMNQLYFPLKGRKHREPIMFTDEERLNSLLDMFHYEFILDRACIQYEPDEPSYQRITSITYQHVDMNKKYELLRSTRHLGPMAFYLSWHRSSENLLLELIHNSFIREAVLVVALRHTLHGDVTNGNAAQDLVPEIFKTQILLSKPDNLTSEDIKLDNKCIDVVEKYIVSHSSLKSKQELALQGFREYYQRLVQLSEGLKKAHGKA